MRMPVRGLRKHVWGVAGGRTVMSARVIVNPALTDKREVIPSITELVVHTFGIEHSTVQVEILGVNVH